MDPMTKEELLAAHHEFPGPFRIKAIGAGGGNFSERIVAAITLELIGTDGMEYTVRDTAGGRHQAITVNLQVQSPEHVLAIYARLRAVEGLTILL